MSDITIPTNSDIYKTGLNPTEDIYAESTAHMATAPSAMNLSFSRLRSA